MSRTNHIAQVVVGLPVEGPFDYSIPPELRSDARVGQRVYVPFRFQKRVGVIVGLTSKAEVSRVKPVASLLDKIPSIDHHILSLTKRFAQYYGCSWGEALETSLPVSLRKRNTLELTLNAGKTDKAADKGAFILCHDQGRDSRWAMMREYIKTARERQQGVIILVPEVAQIDSVSANIQAAVDGPVTVLDKQLSASQELKAWIDVKEGRGHCVIGTRSAVFAPVRDLGLIIIYEEENAAYKQEQSPHYYVHDVVRMRREEEGCSLLFVSSAPSAEVWKEAQKKDSVLHICPPGKLAEMQFVDLSNYKPRKKSSVSYPIQSQIQQALKAGQKVLVYFNRKGSERGIDRTVGDLRRTFPDIKAGKYDKESDTCDMANQVIVATSAVLRHLDRFAPDMIGVLDIDTELSRFDMRCSQRVLSLLIRLRQAAKKTVYVQTYNTDNYCLKAARSADFEYFYKKEIKLRKDLGFPPFNHFVAVVLRGPQNAGVLEQAQTLYQRLSDYKEKDIEVMDPQEEMFPKLKTSPRFTIMIKSRSVEKMHALVNKSLKGFKKKKGVIITRNVDP